MGVKFGEFDIAHGCWKNYIERFSYCLEASEIKEDTMKKANLLAVCGPDLYDLIITLIAPSKVSEVTFATITSKLNCHFHPEPNEIVQSYKFHTRNQEDKEKMRDYIAQLRKLSINCNFTDLDRTLRDRLVCGIIDKDIQKKLLQQSKLTFDQACEIALSCETANFDASVIITAGPNRPTYDFDIPMEVNKVSSKKPRQDNRFNCLRCGKQHRGECRFRWSKCHFCGKVGHIEAVCFLKSKENNIQKSSNCNGLYEEGLYSIRQDRIKAYLVKVYLNGTEIEMEVDSGCAFTIISEAMARFIWKGHLPRLEEADVILKTYTDSKLQLLGQTTVQVQFKEINKKLVIIIAKGMGTSLIGRNWFTDLGIKIQGVHSVMLDDKDISEVTRVLRKYNKVFQEGLGKYTGPVVSITPREGTVPRFLKSRPIPFAIKERVIKEIDRLVQEGVLEPTPHSEWATPIVPVLKPNGKVRLCGDYRSTVNAVTDTDTFPLPTLNEAFAELQGGVIFTKIDLEQAYTQLSVDESTANLLTLNTPKGLYKMKRLPFGVKASPGIFQRLMSSLLASIPGVAVLLDDVVLTGPSSRLHNERLAMVLQRLEQAGLKVNKDKCKFAVPSVEFLGYVIDELGIHPCQEKIHAIEKTPAPRNMKELQAFLGLLNFYDRFMPRKATIAEPLYRLLDKEAKWKWNREQQLAFETLKKILSSTDTLIHYDANKKLILSCDASQYGLGAVLEHEMNDGTVRPIMFASRTMNVHERNYAQIDKEAAAIVFGIKKFHQFISGRKVVIRTDHKPLLGIFDSKKPIPTIISPRMLRWALLLNSYDYVIEYVEGKRLGNADALSRWPSHEQAEEEDFSGVLLIEETPVELEFTAKEVALYTQKDKILNKIIYWIRNGWPMKIETEYKLYGQKRDELSIHKQCILWGNRVVIPEKMRPSILEELHRNHDGIVITKALARSYFWWPGMDKQIEVMIRSCDNCAVNRNMPAQVSHQWIRPDKAWSRLHMDYAGPFQGKVFLIVIDAYSKWPEIKIMQDLSSCTLIKTLRNIFSEQGLPDSIVSDNGRSFISEEFKNFLKENGIKQILVAPYHPASNGQAERTVQTIKNKLKKLVSLPWEVRLPRILYGLRTTPNSTNEKTPAELLNNRRFRTRFDQLNPLSYHTREQQEIIEENEEVKVRTFDIGETVYIRNYSKGPRWLKGIVEKRIGICRYLVRWNEKLFTRHINQMQGGGIRDKKEETVGIGKQKILDTEEEEDENDNKEIILPSPQRWAEIIGVSGPQDIVIHQSPEKDASKIGSKRMLSTTPPTPSQSKKVRFDSNSSEEEGFEEGDLTKES